MIFVDTSAWLALADSKDKNHPSSLKVARRIAQGEYGRQATTNYVLAETLTIIRRRLGSDALRKFIGGIDASHEVRVFWIEQVHHRAAVSLMQERPDKDWSMFDCTSFVVMRSLGIEWAFAYDLDFDQAGFKTLGS